MKPVERTFQKAHAKGQYRTIPTRSGVRLMQHGTVLSEVCAEPGPTHSVADVIAASVHAAARGTRVALLGFAGGGLIAPLRALGQAHRVDAVDLDGSGHSLFQKLCCRWAGQVHFHRADACEWMRQCSGRFDVIIEDLSISENSDVVKPAVTWSQLPPLIYRRLAANGVALFNLLPPEGCSWDKGLNRILRSGFVARVVFFTDYQNRILLVARQLPNARQLSSQLRGHLEQLQSRLASRVSVRTLGGVQSVT